MSTTPEDLKYSESHEWVRQEADGLVTIGITFHAQDMLGDVVFVENPKPGRNVAKGEECGVIDLNPSVGCDHGCSTCAVGGAMV